MTELIKTQRINSVDALRGFALAGVVLVHMVEQYIAGPAPEGFMEGVNGIPDQIVQGLLQIFFSGKFFALFSIIFGLSFAIQMQSAEKKNVKFGWRFLWRAVLLFVIGFVHQLFYRGDILTVYAVLAPFLIPFLQDPDQMDTHHSRIHLSGYSQVYRLFYFRRGERHRNTSYDGYQ